MKFISMTAGALIALAGAAAAETYVLDPEHTEVRFSWNHAGLTTQHGEWADVSGEINFDSSDATATTAKIDIDPASIYTGLEALDDHIKSETFFDVETYPTITFTSTSAQQTGAERMQLIGNINVKGQDVPAVLNVKLVFQGAHPLGAFIEYYEGEWIGIEATSSLLRSELGVGEFAPLTSDAVQLEISAEMRAGGWPE